MRFGRLLHPGSERGNGASEAAWTRVRRASHAAVVCPERLGVFPGSAAILAASPGPVCSWAPAHRATKAQTVNASGTSVKAIGFPVVTSRLKTRNCVGSVRAFHAVRHLRWRRPKSGLFPLALLPRGNSSDSSRRRATFCRSRAGVWSLITTVASGEPRNRNSRVRPNRPGAWRSPSRVDARASIPTIAPAETRRDSIRNPDAGGTGRSPDTCRPRDPDRCDRPG